MAGLVQRRSTNTSAPMTRFVSSTLFVASLECDEAGFEASADGGVEVERAADDMVAGACQHGRVGRAGATA